jgi:hypothetical protein
MPAFGTADDDCDTFDAMPNQPEPDTMKETFHVLGDAPDPTGGEAKGLAPGYRLTQSALGHPRCHYSFGSGGEMIVEADVYALRGQPMYVHLLCPHCAARGHTNALKIAGDHKAMSYAPYGIAPTFPGWSDRQMVNAFPRGTGGLLSIERFRCTWEIAPEHRVQLGAVCDFEVVIDKNVLRRVTHTQRGELGR